MMGSKKVASFGVFAVSAFLLSGCNLFGTPTPTQQQPQTQQQTSTSAEATADKQTQTGTEVGQGTVAITMTDSGFSPAQVTVKSGGTITWVNNSSKTIQVGSAIHPTHQLNQELTGKKFVVELAPGESETAAVTKTGSWGYHNHLNPSQTGKVVVSVD